MKGRTLVIAALTIGLVVSAGMLTAAFDHNPQGAFYDPETGAIEWEAVLPLAMGWFVAGTLSATVIIWVVLMLLRFVRPNR